MKILIDIGHPAHVHLFKHLTFRFLKQGSQVIFTVRKGECEEELLSSYGFDYKLIGNKRATKTGKLLGLIVFTLRILLISIKFRPDIFLSHGSMYAGLVAFFLKKPHIALEDSGNMEQIRLSKPFSSVILSPDILPVDLGEKHIRYKGYHELAYLHPKYFKPDKKIYTELGISEDAEFCIIRFTSWRASHDYGQKGLSLQEKEILVKIISTRMKVLISSEGLLSDALRPYLLMLSPEQLHHAIYYASLVISEGATIASEAGILGTTTVYINSISRAYCEEQERFGLIYNFRESEPAMSKINELIDDRFKTLKQESARQKLLSEKIDVTDFLYWFINNWPESFSIMKEDPDYQYRFK